MIERRHGTWELYPDMVATTHCPSTSPPVLTAYADSGSNKVKAVFRCPRCAAVVLPYLLPCDNAAIRLAAGTRINPVVLSECPPRTPTNIAVSYTVVRHMPSMGGHYNPLLSSKFRRYDGSADAYRDVHKKRSCCPPSSTE